MIYITSDLHFDHAHDNSEAERSIIDMCHRPFSNIQQMNYELLHQINKTVNKHDELIIAGDFAWKNPEYWKSKILCQNVTLIYGNHDKPSVGKYFSHAYERLMIKIGPADNRQQCFISHYMHTYWPSSHYGVMHVYGHHHFAREQYINTIFPERRSMDIGVDSAYILLGEYRPFSEFEIYDILMKRVGHDHLGYYKEYEKQLPAIMKRYGRKSKEDIQNIT